MPTGASGFPGKFSGRSSDLDGQPKHLADAMHFPGKDHSPSSETRFHIAPVSPAQLRQCPVPALARPLRLLTLQEWEGIAPIPRAGRHLAHRPHQAGIVRQLPPLPDPRFALHPPLREDPREGAA